MADLPAFEIEVATSARGNTRCFREIAAYKAWLDKEDAASKRWVGGTVPSGYSDLSNDVKTFFQNTRSQVSSFEGLARRAQPNSAGSMEAALESIRQYHEQWYGQGRLFTSDSAEGKLLSKLRDERREQTVGAFNILRRADSASNFAYGLVQGGLFRVGLKGRATAEAEALEDLRSEWIASYQNILKKEQDEFEHFREEAESGLTGLRERHEQLSREGKEALEEQATLYHEHLAETEAELRRIAETYKSRLGLEAPVQYWRKKARSHRAMAGLSFFAVAVSGIGFGSFFLSQVADVLGPAEDPGAAEVVILLTLATLGVWAIRIFVRLFFSQVHLNTDAGGRAVMIETFLALLNRDEASEEERLLVLNSIFRPSSTGIVKDDSAPPSIPEGVSRLLSK